MFTQYDCQSCFFNAFIPFRFYLEPSHHRVGRFEARLSGGEKKLFFMSIMEVTMKTGPQESLSVDSEFRVDHQTTSAINGNIPFPPTSHVVGVNHKVK